MMIQKNLYRVLFCLLVVLHLFFFCHFKVLTIVSVMIQVYWLCLLLLALRGTIAVREGRARIRWFVFIFGAITSGIITFYSAAGMNSIMESKYYGEVYFVPSWGLDVFVVYLLAVLTQASGCIVAARLSGIPRRDILCVIAWPVLLQLSGFCFLYGTTEYSTWRHRDVIRAVWESPENREFECQGKSLLKFSLSLLTSQEAEYYCCDENECWATSVYLEKTGGKWEMFENYRINGGSTHDVPWPLYLPPEYWNKK